MDFSSPGEQRSEFFQPWGAEEWIFSSPGEWRSGFSSPGERRIFPALGSGGVYFSSPHIGEAKLQQLHFYYTHVLLSIHFKDAEMHFLICFFFLSSKTSLYNSENI